MGFRSTYLSLLFLGAASACSDNPTTLFISEAFRVAGPGGAVAPVGFGPENRLVVASSEAPGRVATFDATTGSAVDAPFDAFPASSAPISLDRSVVLLTPVGRLAFYALDGTSLGLSPDMALGRAFGPVAAPAASLRVATTDGRFLGLGSDGALLFDTALMGAAVGLTASPDGTTYVSTDAGRLYVLSSGGDISREIMLPPPLSKPARLATGEVGVMTGAGLAVFGSDGEAQGDPTEVSATSVVGGDRSFLLWSQDGQLFGASAQGALTFQAQASGLLTVPPVSVPGDRFSLVTSAGRAQTYASDGQVEVELELGISPTGEITVDPSGRGFIPVGELVVAVDFALIL